MSGPWCKGRVEESREKVVVGGRKKVEKRIGKSWTGRGEERGERSKAGRKGTC